jgi:hypothetical protein
LIGVTIVILIGCISMSGFSAMLIRVYAICPSPPCITDNDHDGLSNEEEFETYHTNPNLADTDRDRLGDGTELHIAHTNPLKPDTDDDWQEWCMITEPTDPKEPPAGYPVPTRCGGSGGGTVNVSPEVSSQSLSTTKNTPIKVMLTGSDQNGDKLSFAIVSRPSIGTLSVLTSTGPTSAQTTYTPKPGFTGTIAFTFRASDGKANTEPGTVTVNVLR